MKHNSLAPLKSIPPIRLTFSAISILFSIVLTLAAFGLSVDTSWTYQGQLRRSGAAYTGTCNFQFSLWNVGGGGTQQGSTLSINSVNVANGLFTVVLDFGDFFKGDERWLDTSVQCSGDSGFTALNPRQRLTATPYALSLRPGAQINGFADFASMLSATNSSPIGGGIIGSGKIGLYGSTTITDGQGVYGQGGSGANSAGVFGLNTNSAAIWGRSTGIGSAIFGENTSTGFAGRFVGPVNVTGSLAVTGVVTVAGPVGATSSNVNSAIYGANAAGGYAGRFQGPVIVEGNLIVTGAVSKQGGNFRIDHPLDPANKFLSHSFVESPDMMNIYNGNVITDANGSAIVTLPDYFAALNHDYRYQLTVVGQFAQAIVSREIAGNSFEIQTDKPGVKVSWLVMGNRQDAYAREHPIVVEELKPAEQRGMYIYPAGFGAGEEKQIGQSSRPATAPGARDPSGAGPRSQASK